MIDNFRAFSAGPDPFGRTWQLSFRWQQNAISIRHADTVDVKYDLACKEENSEEETLEKVVALPHALLLAISQEMGRPITDSWCMRLGGLHLAHMVETWEDMDKTLITLNAEQIRALAEELAAAATAA
ncbi:MAG: hypothetical protein NW208_14105 [Bryobacter sp.]|nr:hypothetical protein [Bryobacter sp.]